MSWDTPLWTIGGKGLYVNSDTGWQVSSGDAEIHVLKSDETTIHDLGRESTRRTWRGVVRTKTTRDQLTALVGHNTSYDTPYPGDSGSCRVMSIGAKSIEDTSEPTVPKYQVTIELLER